MDPWYDLHFWSKQYRQEALREARERDLLKQAGTSRSPHSSGTRANRIRENTLALLRKVYVAQ
jgi:hypothetical protein